MMLFIADTIARPDKKSIKGGVCTEYTNTPLLSLKDKNLVSFRDAPLSLTESPMSAPENQAAHSSSTPCNTLPVQWRPYNHPLIDPYSGTLKALISHTPESQPTLPGYSHCYLQYHRQHGILPRLSRPCSITICIYICHGYNLSPFPLPFCT